MPIVRAAYLADRNYLLGGRLIPVGIRDQLVRVHHFIDRAIEQGVLQDKDTNPLVIVGGGVAGVAAAMHAAFRGIKSIVVEQRRDVLLLQRQCLTRHLCPTQYDWPITHYWQGSFPLSRDLPSSAVPWTRGLAKSVANTLKARFKKYQRQKDITVYRQSRCVAAIPAAGTASVSVPVVISDPAGAFRATVTAQAVLNTVGVGEERCYLIHNDPNPKDPSAPKHDPSQPSYIVRGYRFWETDKYDRPRCAVAKGTPYKVLVAGAGDGALQDLLRLVLKPDAGGGFYAANFYRALRRDVAGRAPRRRRGAVAKRAIQDLCDVKQLIDDANRDFLAGSQDAHDTAYLQRIHAGMAAVVRRLLGNPATGPSVWAFVRSRLRADLPDELRFVHKHDFYVHCYPLNRFLALLVLEVLKAGGPGRFIEHPFCKVVDIEAHDPAIYPQPFRPPSPGPPPPGMTHADGDPKISHGQLHRVTVEEQRPPSPSGLAGGPPKPTRFAFDASVFVLRLGIDDSVFEKAFTAVRQRQLLPYSYKC